MESNNKIIDKTKYRVGRLMISITNPAQAQAMVEQRALNGQGGIVGVSCYGNILFGKRYDGYADIMNGAFLNIPDGMPLVWFSRLWGIKGVEQTNGPHLFTGMLKNRESGVKHFLIGDTEETLSKIKEKFPQALIMGTVSPPFCAVDEFDYEYYARLIKGSGANVVWISMTSPKQDFFAKKIEPLVPNVVLIGVGAAFRYSLGVYKETGGAIKKMGLTGMVWRKWSLKLFFKYIAASFDMLKNALCIIYHRIIGINYYD